MKAKINGKEISFNEKTSMRSLIKEKMPAEFPETLVCEIDGKPSDLSQEISNGAEVKLFTFNESEGKKAFWHTSSHVLAYAVKKLYPEAKLSIGPAIEEGFYYDFDTLNSFDDLEKIENEMRAIVKENHKVYRSEISREEAKKLFSNEPYKLELINEIPQGEKITCYKIGDFVDLCAGPHLYDLSKIKAIKLKAVTGAYWKGNSKNKMLKRIYGISFRSQEQLKDYLELLEERKRRDHNKLGRELEIFTTVDYIGQGLPILLPKGAKIIQLMQRFIEDEEEKRGYLLTKTPFMAKNDLYKISGHWDHYRDGMFIIGDENKKGEDVLALRPMTCPFQYQTFLIRSRSFRDLPMKLNETSTLFRNESSGEMHGLIRVRQFTLSEGHIICSPSQLEKEFVGALELANYVLDTLKLSDDISYRFSKWDKNNKEKYLGDEEQWENAQAVMKKILDKLKLNYVEAENEAAFYGPKLDIQIKNIYGKEDTLITIQIDMLLAERYGMQYTDTDGIKKFPYIIHRSSIGCYERTLAYMIEKFGGAFPVWLSPTQAIIIPVGEKHLDYARDVLKKLNDEGIRAELDERNEKVGFKIREAQLQKIPYMLVVGDNEVASKNIAVRKREGGENETMETKNFLSLIKKQIFEKIF